MKKNLLIILLLGFYQSGSAQNLDTAKLNRYFEVLVKNDRFMGSIAVSKNAKIIFQKSIGYCDFKTEQKAKGNSKYRIGSISKTFTAVLLMKAVEQNKLSLNQSIDKYFPSLEAAGEITISQLLYHRSGLHNFTDDQGYLDYHGQEKTESEMLEIITAPGLDFPPGSQTKYSNSNYVFLSYILEKVFNQSYSELIKKYITAPLGLQNTYFGTTKNGADKECESYVYKGTWEEQSKTAKSIPMGAGGVVSTSSDLLRFSNALFQGELLEKKSLDRMKKIKGRYGIGLFKIPFYEKVGFGHTGGIDGFSSVFSHFDADNVSYALLSNGSRMNNNDISVAVLSAVYDKPYEIPEFSNYKPDSIALDRYTGTYVSFQIALKITITKNKNTLIAQASGQAPFPLEATGKNVFAYEQAGVVLEFKPEAEKMTLKQGGATFLYSKE